MNRRVSGDIVYLYIYVYVYVNTHEHIIHFDCPSSGCSLEDLLKRERLFFLFFFFWESCSSKIFPYFSLRKVQESFPKSLVIFTGNTSERLHRFPPLEGEENFYPIAATLPFSFGIFHRLRARNRVKLSSCCFKLSRKLSYLSRLSIFGTRIIYHGLCRTVKRALSRRFGFLVNRGWYIRRHHSEIVLYRRTVSRNRQKIFLSPPDRHHRFKRDSSLKQAATLNK